MKESPCSIPAAAVLHLGGPAQFYQALLATDSSNFAAPLGGNVGLITAGTIAGSLSVGLSSLGQPHLVARFLALRDERALKQGQLIATAWYTVVFFGMCVVGFAGKILLPELENSEQVFFALNSALFPSVVVAVLLAAVLSAIMSTADSMLLVTGTTVAHDLGLTRHYPQHALLASRLTIAVISLLAMAVAIYLPSTIFQRVLFAWVAIGSALGPAIVCYALGANIPAGRLLPAVGCGFLAAVVCYLLPNTPGDILERTGPFMLGLAILLLGRPRG